ncbi:MAG: hypothetical protein KKD76_03810, partial [Verrucomicrobia bacterium]|nr:hypothetical protein [Verrucomicrobiota bacterium]
ETLDGRDIEEIAKHGRLLNDAERVPAEGTPKPERAPKPEGTESAQAVGEVPKPEGTESVQAVATAAQIN